MSERELVVTTVCGPGRVVRVHARGSSCVLCSSTETLLLGGKVAKVEHGPGSRLGRRVVAISHGCYRMFLRQEMKPALTEGRKIESAELGQSKRV